MLPELLCRACSFPAEPRALRPLTFPHLPEWAMLLSTVQLNAYTQAIKSFQLITFQDYSADLGSSCSFQKKIKKVL